MATQILPVRLGRKIDMGQLTCQVERIRDHVWHIMILRKPALWWHLNKTQCLAVDIVAITSSWAKERGYQFIDVHFTFSQQMFLFMIKYSESVTAAFSILIKRHHYGIAVFVCAFQYTCHREVLFTTPMRSHWVDDVYWSLSVNDDDVESSIVQIWSNINSGLHVEDLKCCELQWEYSMRSRVTVDLTVSNRSQIIPREFVTLNLQFFTPKNGEYTFRRSLFIFPFAKWKSYHKVQCVEYWPCVWFYEAHGIVNIWRNQPWWTLSFAGKIATCAVRAFTAVNYRTEAVGDDHHWSCLSRLVLSK